MTDNSALTVTVEPEVNNAVQLNTTETKKVEEPEVVEQENKELATVSEPESISIEGTEKVEKSEPNIEKASQEVEKVSEPLQVKDTSMPVSEVKQQDTLVEQPIPVSDSMPETDRLPETDSSTISEHTQVSDPSLVKDLTPELNPTPVSDSKLGLGSTPVADSTPVTDSTQTSGQLLQTSTDNIIESAVPSQENLIEPTQDQIVPVGQENIMVSNQQQVIPVTESISNNGLKLDDGVDLDQQSVLSMKDSELKDLVMRELSEFLTEEPSQNVGSSLLEIKSNLIKSEDKKKIENLENSLSEANKIVSKEEKKSENDIADALSTLATAALNQGPPANGTGDNVMSKSIPPAIPFKQEIIPIKQEGPAWCDVGVIKGTTCLVKQFYSTSTTDDHENTSLDHLPDYTNKLKIDIQPGTAYKLRIAAINACGRGEWSDISAFKTCLPGYPGAPSAIKITKAPDGASLTWEAPPISSGKILEYSVCLAIKNSKEVTAQSLKPTTTNLNFVRVYCGPHNAAVVSHESLGAALIDRTNKPAIIFRIAAKNEKGYGPATQVRWLQDSNVPGSNKNPLKREKNINLLTGVPKRQKL